MTDDDLAGIDRAAEGIDLAVWSEDTSDRVCYLALWVPYLLALVRELRGHVAWHEKQAAELLAENGRLRALLDSARAELRDGLREEQES